MKTELTEQQANVLAAIKQATVKCSGKNKGEVKRRISADCYDGRTINSLAARGLISWDRGIYGEGWAYNAE